MDLITRMLCGMWIQKAYVIDLFIFNYQCICADYNHSVNIDNYCDNNVHALRCTTVWRESVSNDNDNKNCKWSLELTMLKQVA